MNDRAEVVDDRATLEVVSPVGSGSIQLESEGKEGRIRRAGSV
jgi:hypothetical protein